MMNFIKNKDGVHVLLQDRSEVGRCMIPDKINGRNNPDHVYSDYSPAHVHHNWRYSNVYEKKP